MATRGPRPQGADTRSDILAAASSVFADKGYAGASVRGIAREAGVDPALVHHYFESKPALFFASVMPVAEGLPAVNPSALVDQVLSGPVEEIGRRWVLAFLTTWDSAGPERFRALLLGVTSGDGALGSLRQFVTEALLLPLASKLQVDQPLLRTQAAAATVVGLAVGRYVVRLPEIANASVETLAALVGPSVQRLLVDPLPNELRPS